MSNCEVTDEQEAKNAAYKQAVDDASQFLTTLFSDGDVFEIRAIGSDGKSNRIDSGYFDAPDKAVKPALECNLFRKPTGVYVSLNPVQPALLARAANRIRDWARDTTQDSHVVAIRWLFVDVDPERDGGVTVVPATENEVEAAVELAESAREFIMAHGFGEPLAIDSGNGRYLLFPVDLPKVPESIALIRDVLQAVAIECDTDTAKIDTSVSNPARILRLPGTWNRKGDPIPGREHRVASIVSVPDYLRGGWTEPTPRERLEEIAAKVRTPPPIGQQTVSAAAGSSASTDVIKRAERYIEGIPGAVSGEGGHRQTFLVAQHLVRGFDLPVEDALPLLLQWNYSCKPPWTEKELRHKLVEARDKGTAVEIGQHLHRKTPDGSQASAIRPTISAGTVVKALDQNNYGTVVADHGDSCTVHFDGSEGAADVTIEKSLLVYAADSRPVTEAAETRTPEIVTIGQLRETHPKLAPMLIEGILRAGETLNLIATPKAGKSWLVLSLALHVACGRPWLGRAVAAGRVLLIDNELHGGTLAHRVPMVAEAMGIDASEYSDRIDIVSLRGQLLDITGLRTLIESIDPEQYALVVADAWYRFYPPGVSENDNAAMAQLYNLIDQYAEMTKAAWVLIHHASKGNQSEKRVTDVGSGAGSQSRAADAHIVLREHKEPNHIVLEAAVRSFPPVDPVTLRWEWPLWNLAVDVDPSQLATGQAKQQAARDADGFAAIREVLSGADDWMSVRAIREAAGMGVDRVRKLLSRMDSDGIVISRTTEYRQRDVTQYRLTGPLLESKESCESDVAA